jgi:hypothetical protein
MAHMIENLGATTMQFTSTEVAELNRSVTAIEVRGARLPDAVLVFAEIEAPCGRDGTPAIMLTAG